MILLSLLGSIGQVGYSYFINFISKDLKKIFFFIKHFIFTTITTFGPLKCSLITTTRKFFTVLGSVFIFNNPMTIIQWMGTLLVFIGLALDSKYGKEIKPVKEKAKA